MKIVQHSKQQPNPMQHKRKTKRKEKNEFSQNIHKFVTSNVNEYEISGEPVDSNTLLTKLTEHNK